MSGRRGVLLRGPILSPRSVDLADSYEDGFVQVDDEGRIAAIGDWREAPNDAGPIVEVGNALILPTFVDAHVHLPQIDIRARYGLPLMAWLERHVFPAEAAFADTEHAERVAERFFHTLASNGIGTAGVFATVHVEATHKAFEVAANSGLRVVMGKVLMDVNGPPELIEPADRGIEASLELAERWEGAAGGRLHTAITPRFAPTSSAALLSHAGQAARRAGLRVQTHLAEQREEVEIVAGLFPEAADYLAVYEQYGLVGERSVFAHAIHCTDEAFGRLANAGSAVVCCPTSNAFLGSGSFSLRRAKRANVQIGIGSDVGAGPLFSPLDVLRHFAYLDRVEPVELLYRGTLAGAEALSVSHETGSLAVGNAADLVVLEPPVDAVGDPLQRFVQCVFRNPETQVMATLVEGRVVYGQLPT